MSENQCKATVYDRWYTHRCTRSAGFGRGGQYCKQHAKTNPSNDQETAIMYASRFVYNNAEIAMCAVFDVTEKSLVVKSSAPIIGTARPIGPIRHSMSEWQFFLTAQEAFRYALERTGNKLFSLRKQLQRIEDDFGWLNQLVALENLEEKVLEIIQENMEELKKELTTDEIR